MKRARGKKFLVKRFSYEYIQPLHKSSKLVTHHPTLETAYFLRLGLVIGKVNMTAQGPDATKITSSFKKSTHDVYNRGR